MGVRAWYLNRVAEASPLLCSHIEALRGINRGRVSQGSYAQAYTGLCLEPTEHVVVPMGYQELSGVREMDGRRQGC